MRLNMPITKRKIRNHFQYSFWKYLLLIVIAVFGWNLIYTTTRYRSPENLKIEFFAEGGIAAQEPLQALADLIHRNVMPEMEEVTATVVTFDDTYGDMQLVVWVSAGQGDVYLLSRERFLSMAGNEAMLDLGPLVESGTLHTEGIDLDKGYATVADTGRRVLAGIPADSLTGLNDYGLTTDGMVLSILANNKNDAYSYLFLNYLLTHMRPAAETATAEATLLPSETAAMATSAASASPMITASAVPTATAKPTATVIPTASAAPATNTAAPTASAAPLPTASGTENPET